MPKKNLNRHYFYYYFSHIFCFILVINEKKINKYMQFSLHRWHWLFKAYFYFNLHLCTTRKFLYYLISVQIN